MKKLCIAIAALSMGLGLAAPAAAFTSTNIPIGNGMCATGYFNSDGSFVVLDVYPCRRELLDRNP